MDAAENGEVPEGGSMSYMYGEPNEWYDSSFFNKWALSISGSVFSGAFEKSASFCYGSVLSEALEKLLSYCCGSFISSFVSISGSGILSFDKLLSWI